MIIMTVRRRLGWTARLRLWKYSVVQWFNIGDEQNVECEDESGPYYE